MHFVRALAKDCLTAEVLKAKRKTEMMLQSLEARLSANTDGTGRDNDHIFSLLF
jgi:hypothetical protein